MNPIPTSFSVRDLQRDYRAVLDMAKKTHDAVVLINHSIPEAVVLDIETYNLLAKDDYALDEKYAYKLVQASKRSHRAGNVQWLKSWDELDQ